MFSWDEELIIAARYRSCFLWYTRMSFFHKMIYIGSTYISILRTPPPPSYYKSPCQWQRKPLRIPLKQVRRKHFRTYMFVCSQTWPCFGSWDTLSLKHVRFLWWQTKALLVVDYKLPNASCCVRPIRHPEKILAFLSSWRPVWNAFICRIFILEITEKKTFKR